MLDATARATHFASADLHTPRLHLRRFAANDIEREVAQRLDPAIMAHIRELQTREEATQLAQSFCEPWSGEERTWTPFVVTSAGQEAMMGTVVFRVASEDRETVEIGYRFDPIYHGSGYATEATRRLIEFLFDEIQAHKIVAYCTSENAASYRVMERLGMQREACLREFSKLRGEWRDELMYGLLAGELSKLSEHSEHSEAGSSIQQSVR